MAAVGASSSGSRRGGLPVPDTIGDGLEAPDFSGRAPFAGSLQGRSLGLLALDADRIG